MSHNFRYVVVNTPKGKGYICFSIVWSKTADSIDYRISGAFCSPLDSFTKKIARAIAEGRHAFDSRTVSGTVKPLSESPYISNDEFASMLPSILKELEHTPQWALRGIEKGAFKLGLKQLVPTRDVLSSWEGKGILE